MAGGGSPVYDHCPLRRCFRDMHTAPQYAQIRSADFETTGQVLLGIGAGALVL